ncbi:Rv1733c family protein [Streptomyces atratus]
MPPGEGQGNDAPSTSTRRLPIRASDRIQRWGRVLLVVVFLLAAPLASAATGRAAHDAETRRAATLSDARKVEARLISDADGPVAAAIGRTTVRAPVRWKQPDGTARTAVVSVWAGSPAGTTVPIWTTAQGVATSRGPATPGEAVASAWMTAAGTFAAATGLFVAVWKFFTKLVDHIRYMGWEKEWDEVEAELSERFRNR